MEVRGLMSLFLFGLLLYYVDLTKDSEEFKAAALMYSIQELNLQSVIYTYEEDIVHLFSSQEVKDGC